MDRKINRGIVVISYAAIIVRHCAAVIASKSGGDLLPAAIWYGGKGFRSRVVIRYGKPIANSQIVIEENSTKQIKAVVALLHDEVEKLLEETRSCESK